MMKSNFILFVLLCLSFVYADDFTVNHLEKFKTKYKWSEEKILRVIEGKKIEITDSTYFSLENLGFSESFIDHIMMMGKPQHNAIPERILKHYRKQQKAPQIFALIIGINNYQAKDKLPYLHTPLVDAEELAKRLLSNGVLPDNVNLVLDESATKKQIQDAIAKCKKLEGTFYFFFSGHGLSVEGDFYFACHDTVIDDITNTAFPISELKKDIQEMQAKHAVIFLDACHSGASKNVRFNTKRKKRDTEVLLGTDIRGDKKMRDLGNLEKPIFLMSSCGAKEYSWQGAKNSHFTHFLLEAITGKADSDKNSIVDTVEICEYVRKNVIHQTQGQQKPDFSKSRGWEWKHNTNAGIKIINSEWYNRQIKMQKVFEANVQREKECISYSAKLKSWQNFYEQFSVENNPESQEDDKLLTKAQGRIKHWKKKLNSLVRLEISPKNPSCKANEIVQFKVIGIRGNGDRYIPEVSWKAKGGAINKQGLFTAPNHTMTSKVMAQSKENKKVRKIISIKVTKDQIARLEIQPTNVELFPGEKTKFSISGYDSNDKKLNNLNNVSLTITGGKFELGNVYVAGQKPGLYEIRIDHENLNAVAKITIKEKNVLEDIPHPSKFTKVLEEIEAETKSNHKNFEDTSHIVFSRAPTVVGDRITFRHKNKTTMDISLFAGVRLLQKARVSQIQNVARNKNILQQFPHSNIMLYVEADNASQQLNNTAPQIRRSPLEGKTYIIESGQQGKRFFSSIGLPITSTEKQELDKSANSDLNSSEIDNFFVGKKCYVGDKLFIPKHMTLDFLNGAQIEEFSFTLQKIIPHQYIKNKKRAIFLVVLKGVAQIPGEAQGKMTLNLTGEYIVSEDMRYNKIELKGPVKVEGSQWKNDALGNPQLIISSGYGQLDLYMMQDAK